MKTGRRLRRDSCMSSWITPVPVTCHRWAYKTSTEVECPGSYCVSGTGAETQKVESISALTKLWLKRAQAMRRAAISKTTTLFSCTRNRSQSALRLTTGTHPALHWPSCFQATTLRGLSVIKFHPDFTVFCFHDKFEYFIGHRIGQNNGSQRSASKVEVPPKAACTMYLLDTHQSQKVLTRGFFSWKQTWPNNWVEAHEANS